jgi:tetratricopeptide (TPR) repeat protein
MKISNLWPVAGLSLLCVTAVSHAQLIEEIELRRDGANAIATIRFVTPIQYRRTITSRAGDLGQIFYNVLPARDNPSLIAGQRKIIGGDGVPQLVITDDTVDSTSLSRKLVVRFAAATRYSVRAGRGNKTIEIILEGIGSAVRIPSAPVSPSLAGNVVRPYFITIPAASGSDPSASISIPSTLQEYETFTSTRVVDGRTIVDTNVGYFATLTEAESARSLLRSRFPNASITSLPVVPGSSSPALPRLVELASASTPAEVNDQAEILLAAGQAAYDRNEFAAALDPLNQLLNLPPNSATRRAQQLVGLARLKTGDVAGARSEFELYLTLYPTGEASDRVREQLAKLPEKSAAPEVVIAAETVSPWSGSLSAFYYGGKAKTRSQEFLDSPISGLPELLSTNNISDTVQNQFQTTVDLNWRRRDAETDTRFVLRDSYSADLRTNGSNRNRLSALYLDQRSFVNGTSFKIGRQSPTGGGVLYRFDGIQGGYQVAPKWKINAVAGAPTDDLLDTKRRLYGAWIDAEAITNEISASLFFNQQTLDGAVDRRAVGTDLRYFSGGVSAFAQFDYDTILRKVNITSVQATWQLPDTTVFNFNYDNRAQPVLALGNILFYPDINLVTPARRLQDLLATNSLATLREQVKSVTPYQKTAFLGVTTPLSSNWQVGGDIRLSNTGEVKPVPLIFPSGSPATGNIWSVGTQLIGSNLYSTRDTQLFNASVLRGPSYRGTLFSYNNLSNLGENWQVEPSVNFYTQSDSTGLKNTRWTPGLRLTYRAMQRVSLESEFSYQQSKLTSPNRSETSNLAFYYLGVRYDF